MPLLQIMPVTKNIQFGTLLTTNLGTACTKNSSHFDQKLTIDVKSQWAR